MTSPARIAPTAPAPTIDFGMSCLRANVLGGAFALAILVAYVIAYVMIWNPDTYPLDPIFEAHPLVFFAGLVLSISAHELLHGVGFRYLGGVPRSSITYGFRWRLLVAYAHTSTPMSARAYRWSAALPGLVLGVIPALLGIAFDWPALGGYGVLMTGAAGGDAAILWRVRKVPADAMLKDHLMRIGCQQVSASRYDMMIEQGETPS